MSSYKEENATLRETLRMYLDIVINQTKVVDNLIFQIIEKDIEQCHQCMSKILRKAIFERGLEMEIPYKTCENCTKFSAINNMYGNENDDDDEDSYNNDDEYIRSQSRSPPPLLKLPKLYKQEIAEEA